MLLSIIGMVLAIILLIVLCYKGINGLMAAMLSTIIVIVTSGLPFWSTFTGVFATSLGSTVGTYFFFFCIASAFAELMKQSGVAETVSNWLFKLFGAKYVAAGTLIITYILAYCGINAFIIIFIIYPLAVPMFKRANVSKKLMPAIFMYGSVVLNVLTPGNPTGVNVVLSNAMGTSSFSAPIMGMILLAVALVFGVVYLTKISAKMAENNDGFVASKNDEALLAGELGGKELPPLKVAILPIISVIVLKFILTSFMSASEGVNTSILISTVVLILTNYRYLKGHIYKDFTTGWWSSVNSLVLFAAVMGFATVVNSAPGFQAFNDIALNVADKTNPYISTVIVINIFSGITAASLSAVQIFCNTMLEHYLALGANIEVMHKLLSIAAMGFDTLPNSPTFILIAATCGITTKSSYKYLFVMTVLTPLVLSAIAVILAVVGIV